MRRPRAPGRLVRWGALLGGLLGLLALAPRADACRLIEIELLPSSDLQMVVWIEDAAGNFVDTVFITRSTGTYGLGNRPGRMDFNTSYRWPYGRRISTFPVWSHRHGTPYPEVIFQDDDEDDLSHKISESSTDSW